MSKSKMNEKVIRFNLITQLVFQLITSISLGYWNDLQIGHLIISKKFLILLELSVLEFRFQECNY